MNKTETDQRLSMVTRKRVRDSALRSMHRAIHSKGGSAMFKVSASKRAMTVTRPYRAATHQAARALLAAVLMLAYSNAAQSDGFVILQTPETSGWPIYAVPDPNLSSSEGETLVFFIREQACIPPDFNLLLFFATESPVQCPLS
jgi:hypothetical protein